MQKANCNITKCECKPARILTFCTRQECGEIQLPTGQRAPDMPWSKARLYVYWSQHGQVTKGTFLALPEFKPMQRGLAITAVGIGLLSRQVSMSSGLCRRVIPYATSALSTESIQF